MFIGEKEYLYKGIGPLMILKFLDKIAFTYTHTKTCILSPDPENATAIKAYSKIGFKHMKTVITSNGNEYLMKVNKNTIQEKINSIFTAGISQWK